MSSETPDHIRGTPRRAPEPAALLTDISMIPLHRCMNKYSLIIDRQSLQWLTCPRPCDSGSAGGRRGRCPALQLVSVGRSQSVVLRFLLVVHHLAPPGNPSANG